MNRRLPCGPSQPQQACHFSTSFQQKLLFYFYSRTASPVVIEKVLHNEAIVLVGNKKRKEIGLRKQKSVQGKVMILCWD